MKAFGLWCLFLLSGMAAFGYLGHLRKGSISSNPGNVSAESNAMRSIVKSRKLKNNIDPPIPDYVNLQDYRPINPVPSSKASVRPKPIQHGTPLMPYVPKPSPPLVNQSAAINVWLTSIAVCTTLTLLHFC